MHLEDLLRLWRATRAGEVATLVDRLSPRLPKPLFPKSARFEDKRARWLQHAQQVTPENLATLLDALHDGDSDTVAERVSLVEDWPADPRVTSAFVRLWEKPTHLNISTQHLWKALSRATVRHGDRFALERLDAIAALGPGWVGLFRPHMRPHIGPLLEHTRQRLREHVDRLEVRPLTASERAQLQQASPPAGKDEALAAVWAHPDEVGPKLVYADMLVAEGDPRGEFISLQCSGPLDAKQRRRAAALLKAHGAKWAGPLATVCRVDVYEHGFPAEVTLTARSRLAWGPVLGHPAWNTVHTITLGEFIEPLLHPAMTRVRHVKALTASALRALGKHGHPFPFHTLTSSWPSVVDASSVLRSRERFPHLREVRITRRPSPEDRQRLDPQLAKLRDARPEVKVRFG